MAVYLKKFETTSQYNAYTASTEFITPNVSICTTEGDVHYNPYVPETRVVAKYNVTSTSSPTPIMNSYISNQFSEIEIDGVVQTSVVSEYKFDTVGKHTVKYTLIDSTTIGNSTFMTCIDLTSIFIPDSVTSIGANAFSSCSSLTSIDIPSGVTSIGQFAFYNCTNLSSIDIPNGVTSIDDYTFRDCSSLTSCTIGSGVTSIGTSAFTSCSSMISIVIPDSVTSIGDYTFYNCRSLRSITVEAAVPPELANPSAFANTSNCPIYVPSASVETYRSASGWSDYASRIQAIS